MHPASKFFESGQLNNAISALNNALRTQPSDSAKRYLLAELLCFVNEWGRADKQLEIILQQEPQSLPGIVVFRNLLSAAKSRELFFLEGLLPELSDKPSPQLQIYLKASIYIRENRLKEAAELLAYAEEKREHLNWICNEEFLDDFRDLDDLTAAVIEIFTLNGQYSWISIGDIKSIKMSVPKRPRDLLWRSASIILNNGQEVEIFLPVIYPNSNKNELFQLGRMTEWYGGELSPVRGIGQRMFLKGREAISMMDIREIKHA